MKSEKTENKTGVNMDNNNTRVITPAVAMLERVVHEAISATKSYLEHSSEFEPQKQGRAQDIVGVISNTPKITEDGTEIYEMELSKPLKSNEFLLRDKHSNKEYWTNEDFVVILADRKSNMVYIRFVDPKTKIHTGVNPSLELSFDLRILIINQKSVLENHSFEIAQPRVMPETETEVGYQYVETFSHPDVPKPNAEQAQAIKTMLTQPVSIHIGPPGTGKTVTSAIPIMSYMAAGNTVAIVTPTHVALERSMAPINDLCLKAGIDLNRVVRLGISSQEYADAYPQTLESPDATEFLKQEELDVLLLEISLEYRAMRTQIQQRDEIITVEMLLLDLAVNIDKMVQEGLSNIDRASLQKMIDFKIHSILSAITIPDIKAIIGDMNYQNFYDRYRKFKLCMQNAGDTDAEPLSKKERNLLRINSLDHSSYGNRVEMYEELIGNKYDHLSESQIADKIVETKFRIQNFKKEYAKKKVNQALLIGMTVDSYNTRYKKDPLSVEHIFVDEGGYMPLIKVFGLCRANIPISILGDPKQLPPVSEMSDQIKEGGDYEQVLLYGLSAFHLETLFLEGYEGLKRAYFNSQEAKINIFPKVNLVQTYRFGDKLANILDQYVYQNGFSSAIGEGGFSLEYINAVNELTPPAGRVNPAEADAILKLLTKSAVDSDVVVLTPYKNQVARLRRMLKGLLDPNKIMTIHRSQGQEWHTVIISCVDFQVKGTYGMWFTGSTNTTSQGLKVINTAVSRAKKRLILVGHRRFWIAQEDQLLGELFRRAESAIEQ